MPKNGITPAWHTDRTDYAQRHDTHWTCSNNPPAYVIAQTGDLRVISDFRALDFGHCDIRALMAVYEAEARALIVKATDALA
ncbi:hypothetical protein ACFC4G_43770 [Streptomyces sp. NPDC056002]|uniref:hypothetical protein n=1 Tax=Streptomyces sp. NPDC056002 TaxID=3345675 RepID=UPI0035E26C99